MRRFPDFERSAWGAPKVASATGTTKAGKPKVEYYKRASAYTAGVENRYNLEKHTQRQIVAGVAVGLTDDLSGVSGLLADIAAASDDDTRKRLCDQLVVKANDLAKSSLKADQGTHLHLLTEHADGLLDAPLDALLAAGEDLGLSRELQLFARDNWLATLKDYELTVVEAELRIVNDAFKAAGSLDRVVRTTRPLTFTDTDGGHVTIPASTHLVLDIKTGSVSEPKWLNKHAGQLWLYASSVPYDPSTGTRHEWGFDVHTDHALIAHLDRDTAAVALYAIDLRKGHDLCRLAQQIAAWEKHDSIVAPLHQLAAPTASPSVVEQPVASGEPGMLPPARPGGHLTPQQQHALVPDPDEGPVHDGKKDWADLEHWYKKLAPHASAWLKELMVDSTRHAVGWHRQPTPTLRRFNLYRSALLYADEMVGVDDTGDDILRALIAHVVDADWPLFPNVTIGHAFGALHHHEADALFTAIRSLIEGRMVVAIDRNVIEVRLRAA